MYSVFHRLKQSLTTRHHTGLHLPWRFLKISAFGVLPPLFTWHQHNCTTLYSDFSCVSEMPCPGRVQTQPFPWCHRVLFRRSNYWSHAFFLRVYNWHRRIYNNLASPFIMPQAICLLHGFRLNCALEIKIIIRYYNRLCNTHGQTTPYVPILLQAKVFIPWTISSLCMASCVLSHQPNQGRTSI